MKSALVLPLLTSACAFNMGGGTGSIVPVMEEDQPSGGFSSPRVGEANPGFVQPGGRSEVDLASLRTELTQLVGSQRRYRDSRNRYALTTEDLRELTGYVPAAGIRVSIVQATDTGFSATASRSLTECAIFIGDVDPPREYVRSSGTASCEGA